MEQNEPKFQGGREHTVKVTIELAVFATAGCNDREMKQHVAHLLSTSEPEEIRALITDIDRSGAEEEEPDYSDAETLWVSLLSGEDLKAHAGLSKNQLAFIQSAIDSDMDVRTYSGRGMYGRKCPGVTVDSPSELQTTATYKMDSMGMGYILYAQD